MPPTTHVMWLDLLAPLLTTLSGWKLLHSPWGLTGLLLSPLQPHVLSSTLPSVPSAQPCSLLPVSEICQATLTSGPLHLLFSFWVPHVAVSLLSLESHRDLISSPLLCALVQFPSKLIVPT